MDILKAFRKKPRPLSADVLALLAQAHEIHQAELEFARDEAREQARVEMARELGLQIRDAIFTPAHQTESWRSDVGRALVGAGAFTAGEWNEFVDRKRAESAECAAESLAAARQREANWAAYNWAHTDHKYPLSGKA